MIAFVPAFFLISYSSYIIYHLIWFLLLPDKKQHGRDMNGHGFGRMLASHWPTIIFVGAFVLFSYTIYSEWNHTFAKRSSFPLQTKRAFVFLFNHTSQLRDNYSQKFEFFSRMLYRIAALFLSSFVLFWLLPFLCIVFSVSFKLLLHFLKIVI